MTNLVTADWQVSIAPLSDDTKEFLLGSGTPFLIESFLGLDVDDLRTDDVPRPLDHGMFPGTDLLGSRDLVMDVVTFGVVGDAASQTARTPALVIANQDALVGAWTARSVDQSIVNPQDPNMVLRFRLPGQPTRRFLGRARKIARQDSTTPRGFARVRLQFTALDPRQYADAASVPTVTVTGQVSGTGVTFPATFPINITPSSDGSAYLTNAGNISTYPVVTVYGPITNPIVRNATDGTFIQVNLTLAAGQGLVIDSQERRVLLDGTASRANLIALGSKFPRLLPGANLLKIDGQIAAGTTPSMQVAFRSAWL